MRFAGDETLKKMAISTDQNWWFLGVTSYVAAKYFAVVSGLPYRGVMNSMLYESRNVPIRTASLDLLSPPDPTTIRPEAVPYLQDAFRRKSLRAVDELLLRHGNDVVPQLLEVIEKEKPQNGQALVDLIKAKTGTDIAPYLRLGTVREK